MANPRESLAPPTRLPTTQLAAWQLRRRLLGVAPRALAWLACALMASGCIKRTIYEPAAPGEGGGGGPLASDAGGDPAGGDAGGASGTDAGPSHGEDLDEPGEPITSCEGVCGEWFEDATCACDAECLDHGDCCDDFEDECEDLVGDGPPPDYEFPDPIVIKDLSIGDCRGWASGDATECDTDDCRGIATGSKSWCTTDDCEGIASGNKSYCKSADCKGIAAKDSTLCDSSDCKAIASDSAFDCSSNTCRAIVREDKSYCF